MSDTVMKCLYKNFKKVKILFLMYLNQDCVYSHTINVKYEKILIAYSRSNLNTQSILLMSLLCVCSSEIDKMKN